MTRSRAPVTVSLLAFLAIPGLASAQYRPPAPLPEPVPAPQPSPTPTSPPENQSAARQEVTPRQSGWSWEPGVGIDAGWEQNVGFTRPPGPDDIFGSATVSLARVRRGPRSDFRLAVSGVGYLYSEVTTLNRVDAFASLATQGPLTPRLDGHINADYDFAHTDSEGQLLAAGVLLPLDRTKTARAGTGLVWRVAERTSVTLDGTWTSMDFESELYLDTIYWVGTAAITHRIARRDDVSLRGAFRRTEDDLSIRQGPTFSAGYGHQFGSSLRLDLAAGAGREETTSTGSGLPVEARKDFYGSAELSGRIRRATLSFAYQHGLQPRIGLGVSQVTDNFSLMARVPVSRRLELVANGAFALLSDTSSPDTPARRNWDAYFGVSSRLVAMLRLVAGYRFRVRDDLLGALRNDRATVSLFYEDSAR